MGDISTTHEHLSSNTVKKFVEGSPVPPDKTLKFSHEPFTPDKDLIEKQIRAGVFSHMILPNKAAQEVGSHLLFANEEAIESFRFRKETLRKALEKTQLPTFTPQSEEQRKLVENIKMTVEGESEALRRFIEEKFTEPNLQRQLLDELQFNVKLHIAEQLLPLLKKELPNDPFVLVHEEFQDTYYDPKTENWKIPVPARRAYFLFRTAFLHYQEPNGKEKFENAWNSLQKHMSQFPLGARMWIWSMVLRKRFTLFENQGSDKEELAS